MEGWDLPEMGQMNLIPSALSSLISLTGLEGIATMVITPFGLLRAAYQGLHKGKERSAAHIFFLPWQYQTSRRKSNLNNYL